MSSDKNKKFSTREWWMFILLIVATQWVIHYWSTEVMSSSNMVNYVSFAGTLVSTILAVLAIIYSFIQSASQQTSSEIISREVYRLQEIVSEVNSSTAQVNLSLERLPGIITQLEQIPHTVSDTIKQGVHPLKEQNDGMQAQLERLREIFTGSQSSKPHDAPGHKAPEINSIRYLRTIQFIGIVMSSKIVLDKCNFENLFKDFSASIPATHKSICEAIFISSGSVLSSLFLQKKLSSGYNKKIVKHEDCSEDEWGLFLAKQEENLDSLRKLDVKSALIEYIPEEVLEKLFDWIFSEVKRPEI